MNTVFRTSATRRRVILALVGALALPAALPLGTATASHFSDTEELTAEDAVGSAIAFSVSTFPEGAEEVALGRDDAFADSLASGMLQATRPLLLTASATLSEPTKAELARLQAKTVHVLGGESAITPAVVAALEAEGYTVQRHSGPTRIDTAVEVAKKLAPAATKAIIARAFGTAEDETRAFADSLAAGGWAAATAMPVLLTETEKLSEATAAYLKTSTIKEVFVVGGAGAVNEVVVTQLTALGITVKRVSGPTRFHTALAIAAERGFTTAADADKVIVTEGQAADAWAPGFAAAARSKKDNAPIVLAVGAEIPEPTSQWLSGGEGSPDPEPTEEPTGEPTPDPTETPTPDPSESPTPDPSEPPAEPTDAKAALLCAPMLATEACDAAATALGQVAGAGPQLVTFEVPAVARYDHAIGKVAAPETVNGLTVTGCGYTNEPVFIENDGTVYLMLAGDAGTCSAEFAFDTVTGTRKQTVEFNVGEDFAPPSALPLPELVAVRPVKQDDEGVHLRFVFDEPIAPAPQIDASKFHIFDYTGKPSATASVPSSVMRDPRNPNAVLAVFPSAKYENSTVAVAKGGLVCAGANTSEAGDCAASTAADDHRVPGAVKDIENYPNATGRFGLRTIDRSASATEAPDLVSAGEYRASDRSLLFTFSQPVDLPDSSKATPGAATVLLKDGTIKSSDANGWTRGPTDESLRVTFAGDDLTSADMEQIRRAVVRAGTLNGRDSDKPNTPIAVVISGGGISDRPDFVNVENPVLTGNRKVTFVFEEDLSEVNPGVGSEFAKFAAVLANGTVVWASSNGAPGTGTLQKPEIKSDNRKKVDVPFGTDLSSAPLYYIVLTDAARSFTTQMWNFADAIRMATPVVHGPGRTAAPDLTAVKATYVQGKCDVGSSNANNPSSTIELYFEFDVDIAELSASSAALFQVWYVKAGKPRVSEYRGHASTPATFKRDGTKRVKFQFSGGTACSTPTGGNAGAPTDTSPPAPTSSAAAHEIFIDSVSDTAVTYMSLDLGAVKGSTDATLLNYPAGMAVPS